MTFACQRSGYCKDEKREKRTNNSSRADLKTPPDQDKVFLHRYLTDLILLAFARKHNLLPGDCSRKGIGLERAVLKAVGRWGPKLTAASDTTEANGATLIAT